MRFLLDQDVYAVTGRFLRALGHDVVTAAELNLSRSPDIVLLNRAAEDRRLFVTRDKDFGGLVFVERTGRGVLFLRISPQQLAATHEELKKVLSTYSEAQLAKGVCRRKTQRRWISIHCQSRDFRVPVTTFDF